MSPDSAPFPPRAPRLAELPWPEVRARAGRRGVAILPVGATEAHGPHLPLATDVILAEGMADAAAASLADAGVDAIVLPPLAYTTARFAQGFAGTISIAPDAVTATVVEIGRAIAAHGFPTLAIANAHLEPAHRDALADAVAALAAVGVAVAFPDVTRRRLAGRLGEEFRSGACHAGRYEGSMVMALRPDLVREPLRSTLPPNPSSLVDAIRAGVGSFEEAGGPAAYFGDPAAATAEEGRALLRELGAILAEAVLQVLGGAP